MGKVLYLCDNMGRILAIDYGRKRCGLAVTDVLQIVPGGLCTVPTHELLSYLKGYIEREDVSQIIIGYPRQMNGKDSDSMRYIRPFIKKLKETMPDIPLEMVDERFTSTLAQRSIREAGIGRERRKNDKGLVDELSAVIILQTYMEQSRGLPDFDFS